MPLDEADQPPPELRPLTKRRVQGERAGEPYTRTPETNAAIRDALRDGPRAHSERLQTVGYGSDGSAYRRHPRYISPEALAYLARHHQAEAVRLEREAPLDARNHARAAGSAAKAALAEAADIVAWRFDGLSSAARDWAEAGLIELLVDLLFDDTGSGDVLQVAFGQVVQRKAISFAKRAARRSEPEVPDGLTPTDLEMTAEEHAAWQDAHDDRRRAVAALPDHLREPWELNKLYDIPVQSTDPDVTPLTERFGLSTTTLYNRIREAEQILRDTLQSP